MPSIPPYQDPELPNRFLNWLEELRDILRPAPKYIEGDGSPEGVHTAERGTRYFRNDGGVGTFLYVKSTQTKDATGWIAYG
jgi:hypothetical protein